MPNVPDNPDAVRRLLEVMAALRGEEGCPWDLRQTHQTLLPFLMEEAYELMEAVENGTDEEIREELGDLLLQVAFHARIAEERGAFNFDQVSAGVADKLVNRHGHVFGGEKLETPEEVRKSWHAQKMATRESALDGVPAKQPALLWANQVGTRAARAGFEWGGMEEIFSKIAEELEEIREALKNKETPQGRQELETELGDLMFATVQLARWSQIDPEAALRSSTRKFIARFQAMEKKLKERGQSTAEQESAQWWALWHEAKLEVSET